MVGGLALVLFALWKRSRRNKEEDYVLDDCIDEEFKRGRGPRKFSSMNWFMEQMILMIKKS